MENIKELQEALCDVRKAHRLIYSYQSRMLDLVNFIAAKLDFDNVTEGSKHFSDPITARKGTLRVWNDMWAWDFLYSYVFEYYLGEMGLDDGSSICLSIVQYSDTGFYERAGNSHKDLNSFAPEEESISKLLFIIENAPKKKNWVWDVKDIVKNKEYASKNHTHSILEKRGCRQGLYSFPIERFHDEKSSLQAIQEFIDFCKENELAELEIV